MQKVQIIGNLTKDPEINNGVAKFGVAVNEKFKDKQGNQKEVTEFFNCVMFGKSAEVAQKWFKKGKKMYFEGKQSTNEHEGKRYTSLIVSQFEFLGGDSQTQGNQTQSNEPDFDDDLPF